MSCCFPSPDTTKEPIYLGENPFNSPYASPDGSWMKFCPQSPPPMMIPLINPVASKLQDLFSKTPLQLRLEFLEMPPQLEFERISGGSFCLNRTTILAHSPRGSEIDCFIKTLQKHAGTVITLTQNSEYRENPYYRSKKLETDTYILERRQPESSDHLTTATLNIIQRDGKKAHKIVTHYHYRKWARGDVISPEHVGELARIAMDSKEAVVIESLGGRGRAGTLAAVIAAYKRIAENADYTPEVIQKAVVDLRKENSGSVSSAKQYELVYESVEFLLKKERFY